VATHDTFVRVKSDPDIPARTDVVVVGAGGLVTPSDGRAEPRQAAVAITEAAKQRGTAVLTGCAARGVKTKAGRIAAAVTERGVITCHAVVLAGGAWSRLFCGNLGIDLPQLKLLGSVIRTKPLDGLPEIAVGGSDFAFRKRLDGGYTVARRGANITHFVPDSILAEAKRSLAAAFSAFCKLEEAERWGGLIDVTPDAVPVISPVDALRGFFIATGFSGHGFGIGPGAGRLMADLVAGDAPIVDPYPFRLGRFRRAEVRRPNLH
jgi:glycine/D-amino acid oxidase-like deaminating enzyme